MQKFLLRLALVLCATALTLWGDPIDPATLHIGPGAGTACATGCGGDPNAISSSRLDIYQNQSGSTGNIQGPLLLILGIPNFSGIAPAISSITAYSPYTGTATGGTLLSSASFSLGGPNIYGGAWNVTTGFVGSYLPSSTLQVYDFIGLQPPTNSSNNTTNWFGPAAVAALGSAPTSYGIYVYEINAPTVPNGLFDITFAGAGLPLGTLAIAYGQGPRLHGNSYYVFSTPFTEAGQEPLPPPPSVPEPASILLLGTGLAALAGFWKRIR